MAENLTQYKAGAELLALLKQHGLPKDALNAIANKVADLIEEASRSGKQPTPAAQANGASQQPKAIAAVALRDLQTADAVLHGVPFIIPRGKFEVGFFADGMQLCSKQTSAVVPYSSIQHVLVIDAIPKQHNTTNVVLVMKSGQPIQQGKNLLDIIVIQTKDQPELDIPAPEACQHLGDRLTGAAAVVLSQLLASYIEDIQEDTFLTADASVFSSSAGDLMISANKGASPGWLVPLSAGLCYVGKPGRFMSSISISKVLFHRAGGSSSTFDITVKFRPSAAAAAKPFELGQIDSAELNKLQGYLMTQRVKMGTDDDDDEEEEEAAPAAAAAAGVAAAAAGPESDDDDEEDEDFDPDADSGDDVDAAAGRSSKRQRTAEGVAAPVESDSQDDDDEASGSGSDDDSEDVSLVDTDEMSEDE